MATMETERQVASLCQQVGLDFDSKFAPSLLVVIAIN